MNSIDFIVVFGSLLGWMSYSYLASFDTELRELELEDDGEF